VTVAIYKKIASLHQVPFSAPDFTHNDIVLLILKRKALFDILFFFNNNYYGFTLTFMTAEELEQIWEKQVRNLIALDFNGEAKMSEFSYRNSLPHFPQQPAAYVGRFDMPLLIDPRIPLKKKHKLLGIHCVIDEDLIVNTTTFPDKPYVVWTHDANRYRPFSIKEAIGKFQPDEVGCPQIEVTAYYIQYREIFKDHGIDATGSLYGENSVPCLNTFFGKPEINLGEIDHPDSRWGSLSRGRETYQNPQDVQLNSALTSFPSSKIVA